jgi:beta-glucosidase
MPISITRRTALPLPRELGPDGTIEDHARITFLRDQFASAHQAIEAGVPLESYHVWSLLDNFEWQQGYASGGDWSTWTTSRSSAS